MHLVSCVNFSGKLDSIGRQDAVMDGDKVASERYRVNKKNDVPVTVRLVETHEPWIYTNALTKGMTAALCGEPEPRGSVCRYFMPEDTYTLGTARAPSFRWASSRTTATPRERSRRGLHP